MNQLIIFLMAITMLYSCHQKSELESYFNCDSNYEKGTVKTLMDVHQNFALSFPSHWKTTLYYDEFQSDIYLADTIKSLTSSYILTISHKKGNLILDENFKTKINSDIASQNLHPKKSDSFQFNNTESYFVHAIGNKGTYPFSLIHIYKPSNQSSFFDIKIEIYGDNQLNERICEALEIINSLQEI